MLRRWLRIPTHDTVVCGLKQPSIGKEGPFRTPGKID
jgi:hypothetical protein